MFLSSITIFSQTTLLQTFTEDLENSSSFFGTSVSNAGDVNSDGFDDVIVAGNDSLVYIYYGSEEIDDTADVVIVTYSFGTAASAGDVNNDGFDDIIVKSLKGDFGRQSVSLFFGSANMDSVANLIFTEVTPYFGVSLAGAGDLNNDGFDDIIIGAGGNSLDQGAYIYFGGSSMDSEVDIELTETEANSFFGASVATAGDVNNDGYDDVIVGSYRFNGSDGRALIYFGGATMKDSADIILSGLEESTENFGWSVGTAGDVNNDGFDDILIGAKAYGRDTGRAYIYYGDITMADTAAVILTGEKSRSEFGVSVSTAGDINFDGYDDIIVGAGGYQSAKGRTYIFLGDSTMNQYADVTITGRTTNNFFGNSVAGNLDINNDGVNDILVGAYKKKEAFAYTIYNPTAVEDSELKGINFVLSQNYPNPFNPSTTISFNIMTKGNYKLTVYNMLGQKVKTLVNGELSSGYQKVTLNANNFPSGIYFYTLSGENVQITRKMILLK